MIRTCDVPHCNLRYDDAYRYTTCPHVPLGAGPMPWHPTDNPSGYCREHDLFACTMPTHRNFKVVKEEKMPAPAPDYVIPAPLVGQATIINTQALQDLSVLFAAAVIGGKTARLEYSGVTIAFRFEEPSGQDVQFSRRGEFPAVTDEQMTARGRRGEGAGKEIPAERRDPPETFTPDKGFYRPFPGGRGGEISGPGPFVPFEPFPLAGIMEGGEQGKRGDMRPMTAGIAPATEGPLQVLQFHRHTDVTGQAEFDDVARIRRAAKEIASYHKPTEEQTQRHQLLSIALEDFLLYIVQACPPGPERSTAISWARAAKMFAAAAISLEKEGK